MKLNELPKLRAYSKPTKRRGKGVGSGQGKTAGRGHKGGKARAGYSPAPCCCGVPFYRHFPMRGFSNFKFRTEYSIVNLADLENAGVDSIDKAYLCSKGYIRSTGESVKILGTGEFSGAITVIADKFSASARASIEKSGGRAIELAMGVDSK
ncbi:MAG: 50S ribosomal protein L15 [Puniceicoccales bacterium]|jgi:large subunit ribosomal protein L15|nr:50S ribosomal protein L15 [Puniceicoccales bacterium]